MDIKTDGFHRIPPLWKIPARLERGIAPKLHRGKAIGIKCPKITKSRCGWKNSPGGRIPPGKKPNPPVFPVELG